MDDHIFTNNGFEIIKENGESIIFVFDRRITCGGSKCAYRLDDTSVIMLPKLAYFPKNTGRGPTLGRGWNKTSKDEVMISELLDELGILSPKNILVTVKNKEHNFEINAYISKSFESFRKTGVYIIDGRDIRDVPENIELFKIRNIDIKDVTIWRPLLENLIIDIVNLAKIPIFYGIDSTNYAIAIRNEISLLVEYEIRYFGFDYTPLSKHWEKGEVPDKFTFEKSASTIMYMAVDLLLVIIFRAKYPGEIFITGYPEEYKNLVSEITTYYMGEVMDMFEREVKFSEKDYSLDENWLDVEGNYMGP